MTKILPCSYFKKSSVLGDIILIENRAIGLTKKSHILTNASDSRSLRNNKLIFPLIKKIKLVKP